MGRFRSGYEIYPEESSLQLPTVSFLLSLLLSRMEYEFLSIMIFCFVRQNLSHGIGFWWNQAHGWILGRCRRIFIRRQRIEYARIFSSVVYVSSIFPLEQILTNLVSSYCVNVLDNRSSQLSSK
jgi:hypothetical protein